MQFSKVAEALFSPVHVVFPFQGTAFLSPTGVVVQVLGRIDQDQKFEGEMRSRSLPHHMAGAQLAVCVWVCFNDMKQTNKQNMLYFGK